MRYLLCLALLTSVATLPEPARAQSSTAAQPSAADRTTARRLGIEGQIALKKGDYDTAADRFERANDLVPAPSFLVRLARARVGQGRLVEAYEIYRSVIREGVEPDKPEPFKRALAEAQQEVKALEPRLAWVSISVSGVSPDQVEVSLNGTVIPSAALGAQRPADPGTLHIQAKAEGYRTVETQVLLAEGQHQPPIELQLEPLPRPAAPPVQLARSEPVVMTADGGEAGFMSQDTIGYVTLALGGVGLAIGGVSGILAIDRRSELDDIAQGCTPIEIGCYVHDPTGEKEARAKQTDADMHKFADTATISFIAGGALAATGLILLLTSPDEPTTEATIRPYVGVNSIGAAGTF